MKIQRKNSKKTKARKLALASVAKLATHLSGVEESKAAEDAHAFGSHMDPIRSLSRGSALPKFVSALKHPFGPDANGIRVPDPYSWPTTTAKLQGRMTIGSDSSGRAHRLFLPNPILSSASFLGTYAVNSQTPYFSNGFASKATSGFNLSNMFATYRVASWGVKISNLQPAVTATGRCIMSLIPTSNKHPSENILDTVALGAPDFAYWTVGLPDTALTSGTQLNLPCSMECTVTDLFNGSLEVGCPVVHPKFFEFKSAQLNIGAQSAASLFIGEGASAAAFSASGGAITAGSAGSADQTDMGGGCGVNFYFEGLPASTGNIFDVEYVYHLEGTPAIASQQGPTIPVPSGQRAVQIGSRDIVDKAVAQVAGLRAVTWVDRAADFMSVAAPVAATVNPVAGAAASVIAAALQALR